jgi:hypothetical protein
VHRDPREGAHTTAQAYAAEEDVAPLAAPDSRVRVTQFLKP